MIEIAMITGTLGALLGAIVGSFLATVLVRWPAGESALAGRSRCDGCRRTLAPFELVPVLSFALNRGRCRRCAAPIDRTHRSEEHTSELQSLMRISYAVFCLKKKK